MPTLQKGVLRRKWFEVNIYSHNSSQGNYYSSFCYSRRRGFSFLAAGALVFIVAIGVTAGTGSYASQKAGLYALYVGKSKLRFFFIKQGPKTNQNLRSFCWGHFSACKRCLLLHHESQPRRWTCLGVSFDQKCCSWHLFKSLLKSL